MKKVEPGCKAVTVNCRVPENNGKIVRVGHYIGSVPGFELGDRWKVDVVMETNIGNKICHMPAALLQRIDDREETGTWEEISHIWIPNQVKELEIA